MKQIESYLGYASAIQRELGCSSECAKDIVYLRSRMRWTMKLENELIELHKSGKRPNMMEFGTVSQQAIELMENLRKEFEG